MTSSAVPVAVFAAIFVSALLCATGVGARESRSEFLPAYQAESGIPTQGEIEFAGKLADAMFPRAESGPSGGDWCDWISTGLPFSFRIGGKDSREVLRGWKTSRAKGRAKSSERLETITWTDSASGFKVICRVRRSADYPGMDWVLTFENAGSSDSAMIEDIRPLDLRLRQSEGKDFAIHCANGGRSLPDDFMPVTHVIAPGGKPVSMGGASSNENLPFWNIESADGRGVAVGVGWTGIWGARMSVDASVMEAVVEMPGKSFVLHPGEQARTVRVLLVPWEGKRLHGQNLLRQVLYKHYLRPIHGKAHQPLVSVNSCFTHHGRGMFLEQASEQSLKPLIDPMIKLGVEAFVIDAGWYECKVWTDIWDRRGDFILDKTRFPNGFRPLSDPLAKKRIAFGLWFPPEYIGPLNVAENYQKFSEKLDTLVHNEGMSMYRQDMGILPADTDDNEKGMPEIRHITALYALQDEMIGRYPNMIMEGCSGGGRRVDLESVSRFHWHQKSDRWFDSISDQCGLYGANLFLPGGIINVPTGESATDDYTMWSGFAGQLCLAWHPVDPDFPMETAKRQVRLYKKVRPFLSGDFYPLTECSLQSEWIAYQFHRSDMDAGFALAFRRPGGKKTAFQAKLRGLDPAQSYDVRVENANQDLIRTGQDLAYGLDLTVADSPGVEMIIYHKR